jgi:polar amino acid transport system substrate-binding protein
VQRTGSDEQNLRKLLAGRIQGVLLSRAVGTRLVQSLEGDLGQRITFDPRPVNSGPLHVIFPKASAASTAWRTQFNRGLRKLKASGAAERFALEN